MRTLTIIALVLSMCACGERGHWEAIASGTALGRLGSEAIDAGRGGSITATGGDRVTGHDVGVAAAAGDACAIAVVAEFADNVALGLAGLANIFDPEMMVIAGGRVELGPVLFNPVNAAFARHLEGLAHRPRIPVLPVFTWLASQGGLDDTEMLRTFNCGIGLVIVTAAADAEAVMAQLRTAGQSPVVIGDIEKGRGVKSQAKGKGEAEAVHYTGKLF